MQEELIVIVIYLFKNLFCLISQPIIISDTASFLMLLSWEDSKEYYTVKRALLQI